MWFRLPYAWAIALTREWEDHPPVHELLSSLLRAFGALPPVRPRAASDGSSRPAAPPPQMSRDEVIADLLGAGFRPG